ncbi:MAG TPA: hypothetical protein VF457_09115 [Burkholderiaceae bacterium]
MSMRGVVRALQRAAAIGAGVLLGMALIAGAGFWRARREASLRLPARSASSAASAPPGSYTAPGRQG